MNRHIFQKLIITLLALVLSGFFFQLFSNQKISNKPSSKSTFNFIPVHELIAMVYWSKNSTQDLLVEIQREKEMGQRDRYFIPKTYISNLNNSHFDDTGQTAAYQKEVYLLALRLMREKYKDIKKEGLKMGKVIDVGCGSGFKLVNYLAPEFNTVGIETEPAISYIKKTYPQLTWLDSGRPEDTLKGMEDKDGLLSNCDLGICADVIEHTREPDLLLGFLKKLRCKTYVISTPKRENGVMEGPSNNIHHAREWTFHEFQLYLQSQGFRLLHSYDGVQNMQTQFHVLEIQ